MMLHRPDDDHDQSESGHQVTPAAERAARLLVAAVAGAISAAGAAMILANVSTPSRPYVVLIGLVLGSGWAVVGWLDLRPEPAYVGSITLAVGMAIPIAVSILLILSSWWHPVGVSGALLAVAAGVNLLLVVRHAVGRPSGHTTPAGAP